MQVKKVTAEKVSVPRLDMTAKYTPFTHSETVQLHYFPSVLKEKSTLKQIKCFYWDICDLFSDSGANVLIGAVFSLISR